MNKVQGDTTPEQAFGHPKADPRDNAAENDNSSPSDDAPVFATYYKQADWTTPVEHLTGATTWRALVERFEDFGHEVRSEKDGGLVSLVQLKPGKTRSNANSMQATGWALDLDCATEDEIALTIAKLEDDGLAYLAYTTHSHDPNSMDAKTGKPKNKWRIMGPLAAPVMASAWRQVWQAVITKYAPWTDQQCKDISRGWYLPACHPKRRQHAIIFSEPGAALDIRNLDLSDATAAKALDVNLDTPDAIDQGVKVPRAPKGSSAVSHAETLARTMPVAADGAGGGTALFRVARALVLGLELAPELAAKVILEHWSPRAVAAGYPSGENADNVDRRCENAEQEDEQVPYKRGALMPPKPDSCEHLPTLLQQGSDFYFRESGSVGFDREATPSDLLPVAKKAWGDGDIEGDTFRAQVEYVKGKATTFRRRVRSYLQSDATFDPSTETLTIGLKLDSSLVPTFDPEVDAWLTAFAGNKVEALRQWIAGTRQEYLAAPARALGCVGGKDVGKSMIAHGLARMWGNEHAVDAIKATQKHNGDMARCPIVLADEKIPDDLTGEGFRTFITCDKHSIEPKGEECQSLHGAIRLVVAVNSISKLHLQGGKGAADVGAIADRLFLIVVPEGSEQATHCQAALKPLQLKTGRVDLPRVAAHFRWIQQNVEPHMGERFIGAPEDPDAIAAVLEGEVEQAPELFELLRDYLLNPAAWENQYQHVPLFPKRRGEVCPEARNNFPFLVNGGALWVRLPALAQLAGMSERDVSRALGSLLGKRGDTSVGAVRFKVRQVDAAAAANALGLNLETIAGALETDTRERTAARRERHAP